MSFEPTESQVDLLRAVAEGTPATVGMGHAWVGKRRFPAADLYTLRAARLLAQEPGSDPRSRVIVLTAAGEAYLEALPADS